MSWNHRVVKKKCPVSGDVYYEIHEAYYHGRPKNKPSITINSITPYGESVKDLKWVLEQMLKACDTPVIDHTKKGGITASERIELGFTEAYCQTKWALQKFIDNADFVTKIEYDHYLANIELAKSKFLMFAEYIEGFGKKKKK